MRIGRLGYFLGLAVLCGWSGVVQAASLVVEEGVVPSEWIVRHEGKVVCRYSYEPGRHKPYVKELATIDGRNLLRDSPSDHLHHHALMYAIGVNGLNFWEEAAGAGVQKPVESRAVTPIVRDEGTLEARFLQTLHWLAPGDAFLADTTPRALLVERRELILSVDPTGSEVALEWIAAFEVGQGADQVELSGANYFGLGMRFLAELDPVAVHYNETGPVDLSGNRQDVTQHPWTAVAFDQGEKKATLVLMGDPANAGGHPYFFSMRTPFAYLCATQRLHEVPLTYQQGQRFSLRYVVVVVPGMAQASTLDGIYQRKAVSAKR